MQPKNTFGFGGKQPLLQHQLGAAFFPFRRSLLRRLENKHHLTMKLRSQVAQASATPIKIATWVS